MSSTARSAERRVPPSTTASRCRRRHRPGAQRTAPGTKAAPTRHTRHPRPTPVRKRPRLRVAASCRFPGTRDCLRMIEGRRACAAPPNRCLGRGDRSQARLAHVRREGAQVLPTMPSRRSSCSSASADTVAKASYDCWVGTKSAIPTTVNEEAIPRMTYNGGGRGRGGRLGCAGIGFMALSLPSFTTTTSPRTFTRSMVNSKGYSRSRPWRCSRGISRDAPRPWSWSGPRNIVKNWRPTGSEPAPSSRSHPYSHCPEQGDVR